MNIRRSNHVRCTFPNYKYKAVESGPSGGAGGGGGGLNPPNNFYLYKAEQNT